MSTDLDESDSPLIARQQSLSHIMDTKELQNFAFQIANGMAHLERISITHRYNSFISHHTIAVIILWLFLQNRDLAARNILINEDKTLKISDFGLSRTGPYFNTKSKELPIRWMALEAILQNQYDSKTDVWSFGVVLWEIATLGAFPYERVHNTQLVPHLVAGNRLERPELCTNTMYDLMKQCWASQPQERPSFRQLVELLDMKKRRVYVDFCQINPSYVFPPTDFG